MSVKRQIDQLTIKGFKSIRSLEEFEMRALNVLIGSNGVGKSNFISFLRMLGELVDGRLQAWTSNQGSADRVVSFGVKETSTVEAFIKFGDNGYKFVLAPAVDGTFTFVDESAYYDGNIVRHQWSQLGSGHREALLKQSFKNGQFSKEFYCYNSIANWKVYHFHDTSDTAGVKRLGALHDNDQLRPDASNLAAFLFKLAETNEPVFESIRKTVKLGLPFFDDFVLRPKALSTGEEQIRLLWRQKDTDYALWPSQLSDGSIRFICLVTALLQPDPPSTIVIDEPELGLHPHAITLLGALLRSASKRMQVIVSTQSVPLVNEFSVDDLVVVEREQGATVFKRFREQDLKNWLDDYSLGELWEKNILGGRPHP